LNSGPLIFARQALLLLEPLCQSFFDDELF
jgi:hypothetical protein